jgi:hypothetical protein
LKSGLTREVASTEGDNLVVHVLYYPISFEIYSNRGMSLDGKGLIRGGLL